ncbi:MAG TPA: hypothetical protein VHM24_00675 [Gemmatimonadaceae bacterium]|nr:hypothetical protein [Gemmatimonadaceae bacterium]
MASAAIAAPLVAKSQATDRDIEILRLEGTPIGALSPISLPMPASRDHNYYIGRFQTGQRRSSAGTNLAAAAVGVDLQFRGGSIYGLTAGYQERECRFAGSSCGGHALFGARAQINLVTGGSAMAGLLHDNSTTSTLGTEIGFGYAPDVTDGINACTIDVGVPFSVAKRRQRPRFVTYVTPGVVWDMSCRSEGPPSKKSYFTGFGIGLQQLGNRSLDIYLGMQKVFRADVGTQLGVSITYVRLP